MVGFRNQNEIQVIWCIIHICFVYIGHVVNDNYNKTYSNRNCKIRFKIFFLNYLGHRYFINPGLATPIATCLKIFVPTYCFSFTSNFYFVYYLITNTNFFFLIHFILDYLNIRLAVFLSPICLEH